MTPQIRWRGLSESWWVCRSAQSGVRCRRGSWVEPLTMALFEPLGAKSAAYCSLMALKFDQVYYSLDQKLVNGESQHILPPFGKS